jgi:Fe-S-cluster-containing hydrogenase component 2
MTTVNDRDDRKPMTTPLQSLQTGRWFKLICGASSQHIPMIHQLSLAYSLAGADCIDIAADPAIISTVKAAIAQSVALVPIARAKGYRPSQPWLMVSLNDGDDPHFRKAEFDPDRCPADCPRPCVRICPADAIAFTPTQSGVIAPRCYGCGRCLTICPIDQITARAYVYAPEVIVPAVIAAGIDAIEIHTQIGRVPEFQRLWQAIQPGLDRLQLIAISCPDGDGLIDYLQTLAAIVNPPSQPLPTALIWQTDGRPMSGDIGDGATRACLRLGQKVLAAQLPGFVQLAGGTNASTVPKAVTIGLLQPGQLAGIAYGSYARTLLQPYLTDQGGDDGGNGGAAAEEYAAKYSESLFWSAVDQAHGLVSQIKQHQKDRAIGPQTGISIAQ